MILYHQDKVSKIIYFKKFVSLIQIHRFSIIFCTILRHFISYPSYFFLFPLINFFRKIIFIRADLNIMV